MDSSTAVAQRVCVLESQRAEIVWFFPVFLSPSWTRSEACLAFWCLGGAAVGLVGAGGAGVVEGGFYAELGEVVGGAGGDEVFAVVEELLDVLFGRRLLAV